MCLQNDLNVSLYSLESRRFMTTIDMKKNLFKIAEKQLQIRFASVCYLMRYLCGLIISRMFIVTVIVVQLSIKWIFLG